MNLQGAASSHRDVARGLAARTVALLVAPRNGPDGDIDLPLVSCLESSIPHIVRLPVLGMPLWVRRGGVAQDGLRRVHPAAAAGGAGSDSAVATATLIYRNFGLVEELESECVVIHVGAAGCRVDHGALLESHVTSARGVTVACIEMATAKAREFSVVGLGAGERIVRYTERPAQPQPLADDPTRALVSTGIVAVDRHLLIDALIVDAADRWSTHDITRDLMPLLIGAGGVSAYRVPATMVAG